MRYIYLTLTIMLSYFSGSTQAIKNFSFENWTTVNGLNYLTDWSIADSLRQVPQGVVKRIDGGSEGNSALYLGSYANIFPSGGYVQNYFYFDVCPSGISFDYYTVNAIQGVGLKIEVKFYDSLGDYMGGDVLTNALVNNSKNFLKKDVLFGFPSNVKQPQRILIKLYNSNTSQIDGQYSVIDNLRYIPHGTSINEKERELNVSIFPNPVSNKLTLSMVNQNIDAIKYEIFSVEGKLVQEGTKQLDDLDIDVSTYKNGVYFIKLNVDNKISRVKFIKN